jgi:hypothetical protein
MQANTAREEFSAAMARVQGKLPTVLRTSRNAQTESNYAKHEALSRVLKPIYTAEGFSIEFSEGDAAHDGEIRIVGTLRHAAGHEVTRHLDLAPDAGGIKGNVNKTAVHAKGSTLSYGRRYLTLLLFDVATGDDDDGQAGGGAVPINEEQLGILRDLLAASGRAEAAVCNWLKIEKLEDLPAKGYQKAYQALKAAADKART